MRNTLAKLLAVATAVLLVGLALLLALPARAAEPGAAVYEREGCAKCHAIAGKGNRRHPLDGVGSRLDAATLRKWIVAPRELDPKVRKRGVTLPEPELEALVAYLQSLK